MVLANENTLWQEFLKTKSPETRTVLFDHYYPLVRRIAWHVRKKMNYQNDVHDLFSYGAEALLEIIDSREEHKDRFTAYAGTRIKGAIINGMMKQERWVEWGMLKRIKKMEDTEESFESKFGFQPSDNQIAKEMGVGLTAIKNMKEVSRRKNFIYLDEIFYDDGQESVPLLETVQDNVSPNPRESASRNELKAMMAGCMAALTEKEKTALDLFYRDGKTEIEISKELGICRQGVNRFIRKARLKIKAKLGTKRPL